MSDTVLHASAVALDGRGLLITGPSGSGKSALALNLMAWGAGLVADDRVVLTPGDTGPVASAPDPLEGLIEARGIGLLKARCAPATLTAIVDLSEREAQRLPQPRERDLMGWRLPLLYRVDAPHFASALLQFLKAGRAEP